MFGLHWGYIVIILVVVLIIFGPGRLPELGGAVGKALREFRKATSDITSEVTNAAKAEPPATPAESAAKGAPTSEANSTKS